ncbi:hypothetical protein PM082_023962 [Marasmius tenuissimus]|nr:hypothetical protein PM082_023962 [Marasmius tenuissimus]
MTAPLNDSTAQHNGSSNTEPTRPRPTRKRAGESDSGDAPAKPAAKKKRKNTKDEKLAEMDKENAMLRARLAALEAETARRSQTPPSGGAAHNSPSHPEDQVNVPDDVGGPEDDDEGDNNDSAQARRATVPENGPQQSDQPQTGGRAPIQQLQEAPLSMASRTPGTTALAAGSNGSSSSPSTGGNNQPGNPRPKGSKWSISVEMGLAGSTAKRLKYNTFTRNIRDLALQGNIPWHVEWRDVPGGQLERVCEVAAERMPFLAQFNNHWATKAIIKQWMANKRSYAYRNGVLKPNPKYQYLANNAAKRGNAPGSRKKRATRVYEAKKAKKAAKKQSKRRQQNDQPEFIEGSSRDRGGDDDDEENNGAGADNDEEEG